MKLFVLFLIIAVLASCSPKAVIRNNDSDCTTYVTGKLVYPVYWNHKSPALIKKYNTSILYGEIIDVTDEGCMFDHNDDQIVFDPPPRLFKWKDVWCLIDSGGEVIYGTIPQYYNPVYDMELSIIRTDSRDSTPIVLKIDANKTFSYCLDAGQYRVESMVFIYSQQVNNRMKSTELPEITFTVEQGFNNYLGDIHLDFGESDALEITCAQFLKPFVSVVRGVSVGVSYDPRPIAKHKIKILDNQSDYSSGTNDRKAIINIVSK